MKIIYKYTELLIGDKESKTQEHNQESQ